MMSFFKTLFNSMLKTSAFTIFFILLLLIYNILFPLTKTTDKFDVKLANNSSSEDEYLILVNKTNTLSEHYIPEGLTAPDIESSSITPGRSILLKREAAEALKMLLSHAKSDNIRLYCLSGYRSYLSQRILFENKIRESGKEMADKYVALPGQSEHQTGLALDIADRECINNKLLKPGFGKTKEGVWLRENSWQYGFILRYPRDKEKITGFSYEPWHIRYVGLDAAREITSKKICLEEYISLVNDPEKIFDKLD